MIKNTILTLLMSLFCLTSFAVSDVYEVNLSLTIPRVYDNTKSLGYRKYQRQRITGHMYVNYDNNGQFSDITFGTLTNKTHKLSSGKNVVYETITDYYPYTRINAIGNNKTGVFRNISFISSWCMIPNYTIGEVITDDNALYIQLSSISGTIVKKNNRYLIKRMSGRVTGTQGCGCSDYGHVSPTRKFSFWGPNLDSIDDVASVIGTFTFKYKTTEY